MAEKTLLKKYVSRSLERHVVAPRTHTWQVLLALIETIGDSDALLETVLSFEPPWRRVSSVSGDATGLELCQGTFLLRDDGSECHVSWGVVVDAEPSAQGAAFLELAIAAMDRFLDRVVVAAEATCGTESDATTERSSGG